MSPAQLAAKRAELVRDGLIQAVPDDVPRSKPTDMVIVLHRESGRGMLVRRPLRGKVRNCARRTGRAPRSRRITRAGASRGSPVPLSGSDDDPPLPDVVRLPAAAVLYARAAQIERLACDYAILGRADLFYLGCNLAGQLEQIADRRAA